VAVSVVAKKCLDGIRTKIVIMKEKKQTPRRPNYTDSVIWTNPNYSFTGHEQEIASKLDADGYVILSQFIDNELIDEIVRDCEGKYRSDSEYENANRRIADAWKFSEPVRKLATDTRITSLLSAVYGRKAFPFQTLNFSIGTEQRLHSDTIHFDSMPNLFMTGVWVAFEDITLENGPLKYIKGSNNLPIFDCGSIGIPVSNAREDIYLHYEDYENFVEKLVDIIDLKSDFAVMKKGDVFMWTANLIHGGSRINEIGTSRLSQVTHYFYDDCVYYTPLASDPRLGKFSLRIPYNISTKKKYSILRFFRGLRREGFSIFAIIRSLIYTRFGI
jgi:ectoine hydroxylase-related dioxygenase (phytanoyl-CoA dioxygenase family)